MDAELVTVSQVLELQAGHVVIADEFFHNEFDGRATPFDLDVIVVSPSGDRTSMVACVTRPLVHSRPPRASGFVLTFHNSSKSSFPAGSRIVLPCA